MPTQPNNGTQAATLDTEHTLATVTIAGTYQLVVDTNAMVKGDKLILREKIKTLTGSTSRLSEIYYTSHDGEEDVVMTFPVAVVFEVIYTLEQTDGTGRSFDWGVTKIDG